MRWISKTLIFVALTGHTASEASGEQVKSKPQPSPRVGALAEKVKLPKIDLRGAENTKQKQIVELAAELLKTALDDPDFEKKLKGIETTPLPLTASRFRCSDGQTKMPTRAQIWTIIQEGRERDRPADQQLNFRVVLVPKNRPTVGSTALGKDPVHTAFWFVNAAVASNDAVSVARHFMHEWLHVAGFYHYPNNSARGDVPYAVGGLVREVLKNKLVRERALQAFLSKARLDDEETAFARAVIAQGENEVVASLVDDGDDDTGLGDEIYLDPPRTQQEREQRNTNRAEFCKV